MAVSVAVGGRATWTRDDEAMDSTITLEAIINARLPGPQRGDRYEDPLAYWLEARFPGSRVTAGGTLRSPEGEPLSCAVRAEVAGEAGEVLDAAADFLESAGAPRGTQVTVDTQPPRLIGRVEGVAVYLDGHSLPPEVYAEHDINEFLDALNDAVTGHGVLQAFWEGPKETAVYVYGPSAQAITDAITPLLARHPLAQGARIDRIA
jgi:hypothetical protein